MAEHSAEETLQAMKMSGVTLPRHPARQLESAEYFTRLDNARSQHFGSQKTATLGGNNISLSMPKYFDPRTNLVTGTPYQLFNMNKPESRKVIHSWCRIWDAAHPIVGACNDVYSRYPVAGLELSCKDKQLEAFYTELFLEDLNYGEFLVDLGKEKWSVGEAFPFAAWDEDLGIWVAEELLNPDDIEVRRIPLTGEHTYMLKAPKELVDLVKNQQPFDQYKQFVANYPDLVQFILNERDIPVSGEVLSHFARKNNKHDLRGTPIILRGFKALMLEDRLDASMQAMADRLYSPLLMFKMGTQLADGQIWVPTPDQIRTFKEDLDAALSAEFRAIVTHFGIEASSVFGREISPNYSSDRQFIDDRLFMCYGLTSAMFNPSTANYATSALTMELVGQLLTTHQDALKKHYKKRAMVVAEAQGHFDYEKKGNKRIPIMEQFLVVDDKGEKRIEERPKLLIPEMHMQTLDLRDEKAQRDFMVQLRNLDVPIADADIMVGVPFSFEDSLERRKQEKIQSAIAEAELNQTIYEALQKRGLPIPPAVRAAVEGSQLMDKAPDDQKSVGSDGGLAVIPDVGNSPASSPNLGTDKADDSKGKGDSKKEDDKEDKDTSATGGGGRPNVSDEKKKDQPKSKKKAASLLEDEDDEESILITLPQASKKVRVSMIDENALVEE